MARFARWHIWLGWLVAVPLLLWTLSGLAMVARPLEEVRGESLRLNAEPQALPGNQQAREVRTLMQRGRAVTLITRLDEHVTRYDAATGLALPVTALEARSIVRQVIRGGDRVRSIQAFDARHPPPDLRRPAATWRVALEDGTNVYVSQDTGEIEAVRTRWWRFYDFMWGLHIMDLETREDSHNAFVVIFAALSLMGILLGTVLLFRRRRARPSA